MLRRFKKLLIVLAALVLIGLPAISAATVWTITVHTPVPSSWRNGQVVFMVQVDLLSDGSDLAEFSLADEMATDIGSQQAEWWIDRMSGGVLYELITDPGTEPDSTYTLAFDGTYGASLLDLAALSATVTERTSFAVDLGYSPIFWEDLDIDIGDIGSSADSTTLYIFIVK